MMSHEEAERKIASWLQATPEQSAERALNDTFDRTRRTAQSSGLRTRDRLTRPVLMAATAMLGAFAIAVVVAFPRTDLAKASGIGSIQGQQWVDSSDVAVTIKRDPVDAAPRYWRAVVYDQIEPQSYLIGSSRTTARPPQTNVLQGMADDLDPSGLRRLTFTVHPVSFTGPIILSAATPIRVDRGTRLTTVGNDGYFAKLERDGRDDYTVTALVPADAGEGGISRSDLRVAGTSYPAEVVALYTALSPAMVGPNLTMLRDEVARTAASSSPYDLAERAVEILHSSEFTYDTDIRDIDCGSSVAECFATSHRGFCVHFAVTMAVLLRDLGVPARLVEGFLPGDVDRYSGIEVIRNRDAHAWVEVYFPGHGWVAFDPTPPGSIVRLPLNPVP
jgi:transglutaminase-like putative cysteine protease